MASSLTFTPPLFGTAFAPRMTTSSQRTTVFKDNGHGSKRQRNVTRCSIQIPTHFNSTWYKDSAVPLDVDIGAYHSKFSTDSQTDYHFINHDKKIIGLIDFPLSNNNNNNNNEQENKNGNNKYNYGEHMITYIENLINNNNNDINYILSKTIEKYKISYGFSGILIDFSCKIMRIVSIGTCGLIIIRDDKIIYTSYPTNTVSSIIDYITLTSNNKNKSLTMNQLIHSDFIELEENDLIIAGSDGLMANLTDLQILSFVRPVPDCIDTTLAIANNTCLASWTSDDVDFISYYLASLATNFATAENSKSILRYPFPPSPHYDDVTVLCASCN